MSGDCCSRLGFLNALAASAYAGITPVAAAAHSAAVLPAATSRTRVVLLGTAGGPSLRPGRSSPAAAVVVDGVAYVVDCGYGVGRQVVDAKIAPPSVRAIFITHQHSDHNADLANLLVLTWATGTKTAIDAYGPTSTTAGLTTPTSVARLIDLGLQYHGYDIAVRIPDEGRVDPRPLFSGHEVNGPGVVYRDERVTVEAAVVLHPPVTPALAYRFRTPDRTIVFSGDTAYDPRGALATFARGADLLVHEVLLTSALDRLLKLVPNASRLREHIVAAHTDAEDVGRVAAAAGVKRLALTHFVPSYDPLLTDADWIAPVRKHYAGEIVAGRDLLDV